MGLIKGVTQGNYKCSLRHREHSKAYNQKFNELKNAGHSHDQANMGARVVAKAHVEILFVFEVTSILLLMLPLAPRAEEQNKKCHNQMYLLWIPKLAVLSYDQICMQACWV